MRDDASGTTALRRDSGPAFGGWLEGADIHIGDAVDPRADLLAHGQSQSSSALLRHSKIDSTVRYLGIEVDGAIEIVDKIDI